VPSVKSAYIESEILEVSLVRIVLMACGKNEKVVQAAASRPIKVMICTEDFSQITLFSKLSCKSAEKVS